VLCLEGISELAATEIEDEPLWDGQAKSSRYQDFSRSGFVTPEEFAPEAAAAYRAAGEKLLAGYQKIHAGMVEHLRSSLPRPADLAPDAYQRNLAARAFDVARYLLFLGRPDQCRPGGEHTHAGEADPAAAGLRVPGVAVASRGNGRSLRRSAGLRLDAAASAEPLCPTLARHVEPDQHLVESRRDLALWARQNLPPAAGLELESVDLLRPQRGSRRHRRDAAVPR